MDGLAKLLLVLIAAGAAIVGILWLAAMSGAVLTVAADETLRRLLPLPPVLAWAVLGFVLFGSLGLARAGRVERVRVAQLVGRCVAGGTLVAIAGLGTLPALEWLDRASPRPAPGPPTAHPAPPPAKASPPATLPPRPGVPYEEKEAPGLSGWVRNSDAAPAGALAPVAKTSPVPDEAPDPPSVLPDPVAPASSASVAPESARVFRVEHRHGGGLRGSRWCEGNLTVSRTAIEYATVRSDSKKSEVVHLPYGQIRRLELRNHGRLHMESALGTWDFELRAPDVGIVWDVLRRWAKEGGYAGEIRDVAGK